MATAASTTSCLACDARLAAWCEACCDNLTLRSGLCVSCFGKQAACQHCHSCDEASETSWRPCTSKNCQRQVFVCSVCADRWKDHRVQCLSCWRKEGALCVSCLTTPARNHVRYQHLCKACFGSLDDATQAKLTEEEVRKRTEVPTQTWTGAEPALRTLLLPLVHSEPLPRYAQKPEYIAPEHCRLCFAEFPGGSGRECPSCNVLESSGDGEQHLDLEEGDCVAKLSDDDFECEEWRMPSDDVCPGASSQPPVSFHPSSPCDALKRDEHPAGLGESNELDALLAEDMPRRDTLGYPAELQRHLRDVHGVSPQEYRELTLRRALAEWPQPVEPQLLRCCLTAFKRELCDENYRLLPCAVCARGKRKCKMSFVAFPPATSDVAPSWLGWTDSQWLRYRVDWFSRMDALLSISTYLQRFFLLDLRFDSAYWEVADFPRSFQSKTVAEVWLQRVTTWKENLIRDMTADSVAAPGNPQSRWLLYATKDLEIEESTGAISCYLCRKCLNALNKKNINTGAPRPCMPAEARANGLWRGPQPTELATLSYCEAKVINMARIYVSVKRVLLDRSSYAQTKASETPKYHQKNVVAFP